MEHDDEDMPAARPVLLVRHMAVPFGPNSQQNPWQCVPTAPGFSTGQIGDDIGVATKNCDQHQQQLVPGQFAVRLRRQLRRKPSPRTRDPGWLYRTNTAGPTRLEVPARRQPVHHPVPVAQGRRPAATRRRPCPILDFASFYVMNWTAQNNQQSDPCPDPDFDHDRTPTRPAIPVPDPPRGAITGVFVKTVDYESGPVDADRDLRRGPADPVPRFTRPMSLPI